MKKQAFLLLIFTIIFLQPPTRASALEERIQVATTLEQVSAIVAAVGGDRVKVFCLIPSGADPHHYEPTLNDVKRVLKARLLVMTGPAHLPVEMKIREEYEKARVGLLLDYRNYTEAGLRLLTMPEGKVNPHGYFLSCQGVRAIAVSVYKALKLLDPEYSEYYKARLSMYLSWVNDALKAARDNVRGGIRVAILSPLLQYVVEELDVELVAILVREHGIEPAVKDLEAFLKTVKEANGIVVVTDEESKKYSRVLDVLSSEGVFYVVVPVFSTSINNRPELVPLVVSARISAGTGRGELRAEEGGWNWLNILLAVSITINFMLALLIYIMYMRLRRGG